MKQTNASSEKSSSALVSDIDDSINILSRVDWDFYNKSPLGVHENKPFKCSSHFWGPATFVPEIPFTLIEILSLPGASIYDPFSGVGTTYFQTLLLNRKPAATDICAVNIKYMRSLLLLFNPKLNFGKMPEAIDTMLSDFDDNADYSIHYSSDAYKQKLRPWYSKKSFNQLAFLFTCEFNEPDETIKAVIWISISNILKTACSQDRGWGCIADNVLPRSDQIKDKDVISLFRGHARSLIKDVSSHLGCVGPDYEQNYAEVLRNPMIYQVDLCNGSEIPDNSIDLIVTSPPYPNMTDYATSRRLSYYHIGSEPSADSKLEIGARGRRQHKAALEDYVTRMNSANSVIVNKLKSGGYACYVLPVFEGDLENNVNRRMAVERVIGKLNDYSLLKVNEFERIIPKLRRQHNLKWTKLLEKEKIHLFQKI